ncbi:MAG: putative manganese transporter [Bacteroidales bacterium]|nr:putative manganese transporter [Bacteroidales bacterium]
MSTYINIILEALRNAIMITGLVIIMMLLIEYLNIESRGKWFSKLKDSKPKQILLGSFLGVIPGCVGGFAAVSLFTHNLLSLGALTAMMAASAGDEAFVILATVPGKAPLLFALLLACGIGIGFLVDYVLFKKPHNKVCDEEYEIHKGEDSSVPSIFKADSYKVMMHPSKERLLLLAGIAIFIAAIFSGVFTEADVSASSNAAASAGGENLSGHKFVLNLFNEKWLDYFFAAVSVITIFLTATAKEHFIQEHIWHHLIKKHLPPVFLWSFGALVICGLLMMKVDLNALVSNYMPLVILMAVLVGIIPESGPHMIFVLLFANGTLPFYILLVNSLVQEGHVSLPLLAGSKSAWVKAKAVNAAAGLIIGFLCWIL